MNPTPRRIGLIGGTGLGQALRMQLTGEQKRIDTPFGPTSDTLLLGKWRNVDIAFISRHGPHHTIPPGGVPSRANIYAMKAIGVTHILASGATGSLREEIRPKDLVVPDQIIDKTYRRIGTYFDEPGLVGHVEFSQPFCPILRKTLISAGESLNLTIHDAATYVCMEGPAFSTVAESRMHRAWGGDLIGMTCLPEARLAREAEICYALLALPTDYDCWHPHDPDRNPGDLLKEILGNIEQATAHSIELLAAALDALRDTPPPPCRCQASLDLAVWTKPSEIDPAIRKKLGPILDRYCDRK